MRKMDRWFDVETHRTNNGISLIEPIESRLSWQELADVSNTRTSGTSQSMDWRSSRYFINYYAMYLLDLDSSPLSRSLSFSSESRSEYRTTRELRTCSFITKLECTMERKCVNDNFSTIFPQCSRSYTNFFKSSRSIRSLFSKSRREGERERAEILSGAFVLTSIRVFGSTQKCRDIVYER